MRRCFSADGRPPDLASETFHIQNDHPRNALFNHNNRSFSRFANRFNRKQRGKKKKADVRTSGFHHNGATGANQILLLLCD